MRQILATSLLITCLFISGCSAQSNANNNNSNETVSITDIGSDTMVNLALAWAEDYQKYNQSIQISVTGGGSGTGIAALVNGTVDIANASRAIKAEEVDQAKANGIDPQEIIVARDAIAVIVNPKNPVSQLTLDQISRIFKGEINNWSEVGGEDRPIVRLSRETNSGTHVYFLETVVRLGSKTDKSIFSPKCLLLPSSEGIISEVSENPNAIGYDGLGYITSHVKMVAIGKDPAGPFVIPSIATVNDHTYAVSRDLYMYTNGEPKDEIRKYIDWILSPDAQAIVAKLGFVPIKPLE
jgi:phosphate transport system substrate-binding protein